MRGRSFANGGPSSKRLPPKPPAGGPGGGPPPRPGAGPPRLPPPLYPAGSISPGSSSPGSSSGPRRLRFGGACAGGPSQLPGRLPPLLLLLIASDSLGRKLCSPRTSARALCRPSFLIVNGDPTARPRALGRLLLGKTGRSEVCDRTLVAIRDGTFQLSHVFEVCTTNMNVLRASSPVRAWSRIRMPAVYRPRMTYSVSESSIVSNC